MAVIAYQYRGELVDQVHRGHIAVTDHTGKILWKLGDPERLTFARSSAKPLQAIPVAESGALALPRRSWPSSAPPITESPFM